MKLLLKLDKLEQVAVRIEETVVISLLLGLATLQITQVLFRYFLNQPLHWVDESSRFVFAFMIMIGAGLATAKAAQFSIDFIKESMPIELQLIADIIVRVGIITFAIILLRNGMKLALATSGQTTASLQIPYTFPYSSLPVGASLVLFHALMGIPKHVQRALGYKRPPAEDTPRGLQ